MEKLNELINFMSSRIEELKAVKDLISDLDVEVYYGGRLRSYKEIHKYLEAMRDSQIGRECKVFDINKLVIWLEKRIFTLELEYDAEPVGRLKGGKAGKLYVYESVFYYLCSESCK